MCCIKVKSFGGDAVVGHGVCDEAYMAMAASFKGDWYISGVCFDLLVHVLKIRVVAVVYKFFE